jgi:DNA-binding IscR family transcriptional regulator
MAANSRVTTAAHALAWLELARRRGQPWLTSDEVAASVKTNPVILRRSLGDLHKAGLVRSRRGAGAAFSLARPAEEITMLDVWNAVSPDPLPAPRRTEPGRERPAGADDEPAPADTGDEAAETLRATLARRTIAGILEKILS